MVNLAPNFATVTVNLPAVGVVQQSFNVGLIIGISTIISSGARVATYSSLAEVLAAGFATNSPEYLAAQLYFSQSPQPTKLIIGRRVSGTESSLQAFQACRAASSQWYAGYDTSAVDNEQAAVAAWMESQTAPFGQLFVQSATSAISAGTVGNLFETLKTSAYKRTHGLFSSSPYAAASILGYAMAQTSNLAGSNYTLKFKNLPGVTPEALTETQVGNIENNNGNVFIARAVNMYEQGKNFSGQWFDEVIGLDMLSSAIQTNVSNLLTATPSVPQTEGGMAQLRTVVAQACDQALTRGFLAAGKWTGSPVLTLNTGDTLANGYVILSDAIDAQSDSDRTARLAPNIYACVKEAGAIHSTVIQVNVNR